MKKSLLVALAALVACFILTLTLALARTVRAGPATGDGETITGVSIVGGTVRVDPGAFGISCPGSFPTSCAFYVGVDDVAMATHLIVSQTFSSSATAYLNSVHASSLAGQGTIYLCADNDGVLFNCGTSPEQAVLLSRIESLEAQLAALTAEKR